MIMVRKLIVFLFLNLTYYKKSSTPEDGYGGQYIQDITAKVMENYY